MEHFEIWKFQLPITDYPVVPMPRYSHIMHIAEQPGDGVVIWAIVRPGEAIMQRRFRVVGTHVFDLGEEVRS